MLPQPQYRPLDSHPVPQGQPPASDPEGTFTTATLVDLGKESTSGGIDRQSATTFFFPATCQISEEYSAT